VSMLSVHNLSKSYPGPDGAVQALADVSLEVARGELVVVRGPSGSGKTTLLLAAGGLLAPDSGVVEVDGKKPYALDPDERAALRAAAVGFVFQQFHLVPYLSVLDNVLAPTLAGNVPDAGHRARELIEAVGLADRADHLPGALSTGERQRVALARAFLNRPALLLADEPTGNLDEQNAATVLKHLADFAGNGGAVLLVTHDVFAEELPHRTLHLKAGRLAGQ